MGELIQLTNLKGQKWPKLATGARRKVLTIEYGQQHELPHGALALCFFLNATPRVLLLCAAGRRAERTLSTGKTVTLGEGVTLTVLASGSNNRLYLELQDTRPLITLARGEQA